MYQIVTGIAPEDPQTEAKVSAITELPAAAETVAVTIVHVSDSERELRSVPAVDVAYETLTEHGIDVTLRRSTATPLNAVLAVADDLDADCICIGGRRRSPAGKNQLRSGSEAVILNTERPVLIAGHTTQSE
ncbi:universal stress protein [Halocatena halophila]|uniref:universal stress protein n=1 Tax=Halocatena halophila TaxID=2814576 RepID=UPI002ED2509D